MNFHFVTKLLKVEGTDRPMRLNEKRSEIKELKFCWK